MKSEITSLRKSINKAFLKEVVDRDSFNEFKIALGQLLENIKSAEKKDEHEEHFKNFLVPFFNEVGFGDYYINTNVRIDLAIHTGGKVKEPVGVLIEVKRPSNKNEMITGSDFNRKAMHEAVLYYLQQRIEEENTDIKHIVVTDMLNWFVFDAQEFERCFYKPTQLKKIYQSWQADQKVSSNKDFMYDQIARFLDEQETTIRGLYLDLKEYGHLLEAKEDSEHEKKLIPLYKFFSPTHLLKEPFANDSNTLNREFYRELLYILGLEEVKDGSTRYIERAGQDNRQTGSLIENTIRILDTEDHLSTVREPKIRYGDGRGDQLFNVALELGITWMNRILFLKLLEAQLFRYHRQDKKFKFLNAGTIEDYDELNKLFFQVLARREKDRTDDVNEQFGHIPYLNSSLFDPATLEHEAVFISNLDDKQTLPVYNRSVLKDRRGEELNTLHYLFEFLDAYDFAAEGGEEIQQERKTLINASVLGLIFEKINGYKDGSFFTPGFITEYMARETLRKAVVDKFRLTLSRNPETPSPQGPLSNSLPEGERTISPSPGGGRIEDGGEQGTRGMSSEEPATKLPEELLEQARHLRKNQTEAETLLWQLLRNRQLNGYKFRRQHPIKEGLILDFYCHEAKLAIEVDGGYHDAPEQQAADKERTSLLNDMGIRVIRFRNEAVLEDTESVLEEIAGVLEEPSPQGPHSGSLPEGERTTTEDGGGKLSFTDIYNAIGRDISMERANELVNSITICDPAVGSGHFLVSCLNELLAIKSDLGILCDREGKRLRGVNIEIENDELIVTWGDEELFEYDVAHTWQGSRLTSRKVAPDRQRIQKALFHEKRHIIENCLFGVDINPNSVKICQLRLWIELLKNTYYIKEPLNLSPSPSREKEAQQSADSMRASSGEYTRLQVLPNIDINIKTGNSLVSRFELDSDLSSVFKDSEHSLEDYKEAVRNYKHTGDRGEKQRLQKLIDDIKEEYSTTLLNNRPINKKLSKQRGRLDLMQNADLFGDQKFTKKEIKKQEKKVKKLEEQKAEEESGAFYNQAFEWRFEFPEVLDEEGGFTGFDVVIGNPPYIRQEQLGEQKEYLKTNFEVYQGTADLYAYFIEQGMNLLRKGGVFHYIISNKWMRANYGKPLRKWMQQYQIESIIDFGDLPVFEEATTYPCLLQLQKAKHYRNFWATEVKHLDFGSLTKYLSENEFEVNQSKLSKDGWTLVSKKAQELLDKVKKKGGPLGEYVEGKIYRGILTGLNEAFIIDEKTKNKLLEKKSKGQDLIKPFLKGRDINRYELPESDKYLILIPNGWTNSSTNSEDKWKWFKSEYPTIAKYLKQFEEKAKKRYDQGEYWWELRACSYYDEFEQPKIILPDISLRGNFTLDSKGDFYMVNTAYMICNSEKYLLGLLASDLIDFFYKNISSKYRGNYLRFIYQYLEQIPIVEPEDDIKQKIESLVDQILTDKKDDPEADTSELEAEIDQLVYELYGLSEEEIEIVEESVG